MRLVRALLPGPGREVRRLRRASPSFFGLAVLSVLYFSQARELKRLREWAGRAPERARELEQRVVAQATATVARRAPRPSRRGKPAGAIAPAAPARGDAGAAAAPQPAAGGRRAGGTAGRRTRSRDERQRAATPGAARRGAAAAPRRRRASRRGRGGRRREPAEAEAPVAETPRSTARRPPRRTARPRPPTPTADADAERAGRGAGAEPRRPRRRSGDAGARADETGEHEPAARGHGRPRHGRARPRPRASTSRRPATCPRPSRALTPAQRVGVDAAPGAAAAAPVPAVRHARRPPPGAPRRPPAARPRRRRRRRAAAPPGTIALLVGARRAPARRRRVRRLAAPRRRRRRPRRRTSRRRRRRRRARRRAAPPARRHAGGDDRRRPQRHDLQRPRGPARRPVAQEGGYERGDDGDQHGDQTLQTSTVYYADGFRAPGARRAAELLSIDDGRADRRGDAALAPGRRRRRARGRRPGHAVRGRR